MNTYKAFVLMPFADELTDVYKLLIAPALSEAGYEVMRADDIHSQNNILNDIMDGITSSHLIVADLTGSNPNVYYELGIAHALYKDVILLTQDIAELPFDLRPYRVVSYSVNFAKVNQAKKELYELASKTIQGKLIFGNPVKDFCGTEQNSTYKIKSTSNVPEEDSKSDCGLLDHRINVEDGFQEMTRIVTDVGTKLKEEVTVAIVEATQKLTTGKHSAKQERNIVIELAGQIQRYGAFLKKNNEKYRSQLNNVESGLEFILSGESGVKYGSLEVLKYFIDTLTTLKDSASNGRQGFANLIEAMDKLPNIEKSFSRAKLFMVTELKEFVANIDQTIAVTSRATQLGKSLLEKKT